MLPSTKGWLDYLSTCIHGLFFIIFMPILILSWVFDALSKKSDK